MTLTTTTTTNSRRRPTLSEQIERLDSTLDGLAAGLNEAVADAVRSAVGVAVREAVQATLAEVLTNPEVLKRLRAATTPVTTPPTIPTTPEVKKPGLWERLGMLWQGVRGYLAGLRASCGSAVRQVGHWFGGLWQRTLQGCVSLWHRCRAWSAGKYELLTALGVGSSVAVLAWYAGPRLAALLSGVGGLCAALAVPGWLWLRRALTLAAERCA